MTPRTATPARLQEYVCTHCGKQFVVPSLARHHEQHCTGGNDG